jgi:hypothetical protein
VPTPYFAPSYFAPSYWGPSYFPGVPGAGPGSPYFAPTYWASAYFAPSYFPGSPGAGSAVQYHVYANDGSDGPVDYTSAIATVDGLSYEVGPLAIPSDWTFAVRAFDVSSGLEEKNVDARVRIHLSAAGVDLGRLPNAPSGLAARATAAGTATVTWSYVPLGQGSAPAGFRVYVGLPTPSYASPAATVPYSASLSQYRAPLSGLAGGDAVGVAVRAYNSGGEEQNAVVVTFVAAATGPDAVSGLTAVVVS